MTNELFFSRAKYRIESSQILLFFVHRIVPAKASHSSVVEATTKKLPNNTLIIFLSISLNIEQMTPTARNSVHLLIPLAHSY